VELIILSPSSLFRTDSATKQSRFFLLSFAYRVADGFADGLRTALRSAPHGSAGKAEGRNCLISQAISGVAVIACGQVDRVDRLFLHVTFTDKRDEPNRLAARLANYANDTKALTERDNRPPRCPPGCEVDEAGEWTPMNANAMRTLANT